MDVKYKLTSQHQQGSQKDPPQSTHNPLQECKLGNLLSKLFLTDICDKKSPGLWILNANRVCARDVIKFSNAKLKSH